MPTYRNSMLTLFASVNIRFVSTTYVVEHIMTPGRPTIWTIFCLLCITIQGQNNVTAEEDLVDEYYTTTPTKTDKFLPEDDKDAQAIIDSNKKEEVIASILLYRDKVRRYAISEKIMEKIMIGGTRRERREQRRYWIVDWYSPQYHQEFKDLCYGLVKDESLVLAGYLYNFFYQKDQSRIVRGMVLIKDLENVISTYEKINYGSFKDGRKNQDGSFEHMLRVWVRHKREPIEKEEISKDAITLNAKALKAEFDDGGWHENRDKIEFILMKKSIIFARKVIEEFEAMTGKKPIEDTINESIEKCELDRGLADAYSSLARYIKDKFKYTADILRKYGDDSEQWATWIMCIAVIHPQEWPKVNEAFKKDHKDDSLSKFILEKLTKDKVMAESIAVIVDPNFKPTTFSKKVYENDPTSGQPAPTTPP